MFVCLDQRTGTGCGASNPADATHCHHCGRTLRFAMHLLDPGTVVGHYRVLNTLGHGGFGAVYEAEDTRQPGFRVALKETFDPATIRSFQGEFAVLRNLQHPHLPRYYEMFEAGENGYLVMELVPGQSLQDVLDKQRGPLLESQVLGYALQMCDALAYLHDQNPPIVHRDIKPANVRLTPEGLIKLVDFGLLKQGGGQTQSSRRGLTPAYAPIEQWGQVGYHTDARSDLYGLAATLYHLLTGRSPLAATDRLATPVDPLPPPRALNPALSPHVSEAIVRAMALQQQARPANVGVFKQALIGAGGQQASAAPVSPGHHPAPVMPSGQPARPLSAPLAPATAVPERRFPPWLWALGGMGLLLVALVLVGLAVTAVLVGLRGTAAVSQDARSSPVAESTAVLASDTEITTIPSPAVQTTPVLTPTPTSASMAIASPAAVLTPAPAATQPPSPVPSEPDGCIVFDSYTGNNWDVYYMDPGGALRVNVTNHTANDGDPVWSPDAQRIAFDSDRDGNWEIYVTDVGGVRATRLTHHSADDDRPTWLPDGRHIAFESGRDGNREIYIVDVDTLEVTNLTNHTGGDQMPDWSPDGRLIALNSDRSGNWEIYRMNADGSQLTNLTNHPAEDGFPKWSPDGQRIVFHSYRDGDAEIYVINADGSGLTRLTYQAGDDWAPAWSPDGAWIAFTSERDGNYEIYIMRSDGSDTRRLTNNSVRDTWPHWSSLPCGTAASAP